MKKKELFSKSNKLTKKEEQKLRKQFPNYNKDRLVNKLEIMAILFWLIMLVGAIYILYLMLTYKW